MALNEEMAYAIEDEGLLVILLCIFLIKYFQNKGSRNQYNMLK